MKKTFLQTLLLAFCCAITFTSCKKKTTLQSTNTEKGTYISVAGQPQSKAPYTITLVEVGNNPSAPALQSFAWASVGNTLLIVGGRTNGFHGFDPATGSTFPSKRSNTYFYVVDLDSNNTDSLPIPSKYATQLSSTNMEYYADGNTLYCIGGYGSNCPADSPKCYQTFPQLVAIDINAAMSAISSNNAAALENSITAIKDERMRVTGGELHKIGDWFYLVVGQNYDAMYRFQSGKYTNEIRRFKIENKKNKLAIKDYTVFANLWGGNWTDQLHRRDLVVLETVMADGSTGITVYGGVFTPVNDNAYVNPIYISQKGDSSTFALDTVFAQKFCLYAAPTVAMYDNNEKAMYTTILGGISKYYFDSTGTLVNGDTTANNQMPFTNNVTTIVRGADNGSVEYPQQTPVLPGATGLIGAEAVFVPAPGIPMYPGTKKVIDYNKLPAQGNVVLGLMYAGISAQSAQSPNKGSSTKASNKIYQVILSR